MSIENPAQPVSAKASKLLSVSDPSRPEWSLFSDLLGKECAPSGNPSKDSVQLKSLLDQCIKHGDAYYQLILRATGPMVSRFVERYPQSGMTAGQILRFVAARVWNQNPYGRVVSSKTLALEAWDPQRTGIIPRIRHYANAALNQRDGLAEEIQEVTSHVSLDALKETGRELASDGKFVTEKEHYGDDLDAEEQVEEASLDDVVDGEHQGVSPEQREGADLILACFREASGPFDSQRADVRALTLLAGSATETEQFDLETAEGVRGLGMHLVRRHLPGHEDRDSFIDAIGDWEPSKQTFGQWCPDVVSVLADAYLQSREKSVEFTQSQMNLSNSAGVKTVISEVEAELLEQEGLSKRQLLQARYGHPNELAPMRPDYLLLCIQLGQKPDPKLKGEAMATTLREMASLVWRQGLNTIDSSEGAILVQMRSNLDAWNPAKSYWHDEVQMAAFLQRNRPQPKEEPRHDDNDDNQMDLFLPGFGDDAPKPEL